MAKVLLACLIAWIASCDGFLIPTQTHNSVLSNLTTAKDQRDKTPEEAYYITIYVLFGVACLALVCLIYACFIFFCCQRKEGVKRKPKKHFEPTAQAFTEVGSSPSTTANGLNQQPSGYVQHSLPSSTYYKDSLRNEGNQSTLQTHPGIISDQNSPLTSASYSDTCSITSATAPYSEKGYGMSSPATSLVHSWNFQSLPNMENIQVNPDGTAVIPQPNETALMSSSEIFERQTRGSPSLRTPPHRKSNIIATPSDWAAVGQNGLKSNQVISESQVRSSSTLAGSTTEDLRSEMYSDKSTQVHATSSGTLIELEDQLLSTSTIGIQVDFPSEDSFQSDESSKTQGIQIPSIPSSTTSHSVGSQKHEQSDLPLNSSPIESSDVSQTSTASHSSDNSGLKMEVQSVPQISSNSSYKSSDESQSDVAPSVSQQVSESPQQQTDPQSRRHQGAEASNKSIQVELLSVENSSTSMEVRSEPPLTTNSAYNSSDAAQSNSTPGSAQHTLRPTFQTEQSPGTSGASIVSNKSTQVELLSAAKNSRSLKGNKQSRNRKSKKHNDSLSKSL